MSAVDQDRELYFSRAAKIDQLVERGAYCSAGVQDIINQNDVAVVDVLRDVGSIYNRPRTDRREIIAIESYVELTGSGPFALELLNLVRDSFGEWNTAPANSDEHEVLDAAVPFDDLRSETRDRPANSELIHDSRLLLKGHPSPFN